MKYNTYIPRRTIYVHKYLTEEYIEYIVRVFGDEEDIPFETIDFEGTGLCTMPCGICGLTTWNEFTQNI